jgi:ADP-ribosyl-[dinitrogen reductase] hydrolase
VLLGERRHVLLHCMGGLGRSGMVAARLLVELGEEPRTAIQRVRAARPGAIETAAQEAYVLACRAVEPGGA